MYIIISTEKLCTQTLELIQDKVQVLTIWGGGRKDYILGIECKYHQYYKIYTCDHVEGQFTQRR